MQDLRILIIDDSASYQKILQQALSHIEGVEVIGTASDGPEGIGKIEEDEPDLVLLDIVMPKMNGLAVLEYIRKAHPTVSVLMVSGDGEAKNTLRALSLGAVDFILKPTADATNTLREHLYKGVRVVRAQRRSATGESEPPRRRKEEARAADPVHQVARAASRSRLVVIGISTGGPRALEELIPALPSGLPCPILIVQHMPAAFTESLANSLDNASPLDVAEAKDGDVVRAGQVLLAPGGRHMEVVPVPDAPSGLAIRIHDGPPVNECRPAVDLLMKSVAKHYNGEVLAAVLTGMGYDGNAGVAALKEKGAYCITQDEATSVVYGMPRVVVEAGNADEVLPLTEIAPRLVAWASGLDGGSRA
ncbi:MAG: chemotaxis response regulator protein-glutamate methylesterase [Myxococcota bacterium]|jgi:two-component system chemotaxis response regulator CheB|nr:chemotaxis response regulator protein-glutamate methylesterase [Myxococcota bacterium]